MYYLGQNGALEELRLLSSIAIYPTKRVRKARSKSPSEAYSEFWIEGVVHGA